MEYVILLSELNRWVSLTEAPVEATTPRAAFDSVLEEAGGSLSPGRYAVLDASAVKYMRVEPSAGVKVVEE